MASSRSNEMWRPVRGYEGYYEVSNLGRVRRIEGRPTCDGRRYKGKILAQRACPYHTRGGKESLRVNLAKDGVRSEYLVARLVCTAFHGVPSDPTFTVDHLDNDPANNHADNLEWVTRSENLRRGWASGCFNSKRKGWCVCDA